LELVEEQREVTPRINSACHSGMLDEGLSSWTGAIQTQSSGLRRGIVIRVLSVRVRVLLGTAALVHAGGVVWKSGTPRSLMGMGLRREEGDAPTLKDASDEAQDNFISSL
jgi:hypothetical protein